MASTGDGKSTKKEKNPYRKTCSVYFNVKDPADKLAHDYAKKMGRNFSGYIKMLILQSIANGTAPPNPYEYAQVTSLEEALKNVETDIHEVDSLEEVIHQPEKVEAEKEDDSKTKEKRVTESHANTDEEVISDSTPESTEKETKTSSEDKQKEKVSKQPEEETAGETGSKKEDGMKNLVQALLKK